MEKINGICVDGRFYEAIPAYGAETCEGCPTFQGQGCPLAHYCSTFDDSFLRYSPELTDKINEI